MWPMAPVWVAYPRATIFEKNWVMKVAATSAIHESLPFNAAWTPGDWAVAREIRRALALWARTTFVEAFPKARAKYILNKANKRKTRCYWIVYTRRCAPKFLDDVRLLPDSFPCPHAIPCPVYLLPKWSVSQFCICPLCCVLYTIAVASMRPELQMLK